MEKYIDLKDITITGKKIGDIAYKPKKEIYIMLICAFLFLFVPGVAAKLLGIFVAAVVCIVYFQVEDRLVMSVYDDCIIIYNPRDNSQGFKLELKDIEQYDCAITEQYQIYFKLFDGREFKKETYRMDLARKYLKIALPGKTTSEVRQAKFRSMKFDPVKGAKRIFNKLLKKGKKE